MQEQRRLVDCACASVGGEHLPVRGVFAEVVGPLSFTVLFRQATYTQAEDKTIPPRFTI